jgi:hypothetical protein
MRELALRPGVPLDIDAQYCDIIRRGDDYYIRLKGRGEREYEVLYLSFAPAVAALLAAGLVDRPPAVPDAMGADHWKPVMLRHRALRVTLASDGQLGIVRRPVAGSEAAEHAMYLGAVDFVLRTIVPRFRANDIPVGDVATAAMVNAVYNKRLRGGGHGHHG